ncbi:MAG: inositol monophosphatase family protein [Pseudomonadota bacterium]
MAAAALAREAGQLARGYQSDLAALKIELKGPQDFHTVADDAVERRIVSRLADAFPGDTVIGEEGGGALSDRVWVIDPIDGTANFAHGLAQFCVSVAFVENGRTEIGVIYEPVADCLYAACRGWGATRNGLPIRASDTADAGRAMLDVGYSRRRPVEEYCGLVLRLLRLGFDVTQLGSAALGLARVAEGRIDGFYESHLYPWDALAGLLLVHEAGGWTSEFPLDRAGGHPVLGCASALRDVLGGMTGMV